MPPCVMTRLVWSLSLQTVLGRILHHFQIFLYSFPLSVFVVCRFCCIFAVEEQKREQDETATVHWQGVIRVVGTHTASHGDLRGIVCARRGKRVAHSASYANSKALRQPLLGVVPRRISSVCAVGTYSQSKGGGQEKPCRKTASCLEVLSLSGALCHCHCRCLLLREVRLVVVAFDADVGGRDGQA